MSQIVSSVLNQKAVYWGGPTPDGYGGSTYEAPREIKCRWQDGNAVFVDQAGREAVSKAQVYVAEDLAVGGHLRLCTLAELSSGAETPGEGLDTAEIRSVGKTWDVSGIVPLRKVFLV
jgi:hypothetical protein